MTGTDPSKAPARRYIVTLYREEAYRLTVEATDEEAAGEIALEIFEDDPDRLPLPGYGATQVFQVEETP